MNLKDKLENDKTYQQLKTKTSNEVSDLERTIETYKKEVASLKGKID